VFLQPALAAFRPVFHQTLSTLFTLLYANYYFKTQMTLKLKRSKYLLERL